MPPAFYAHDPFLKLHGAMQRPWLDAIAAIASTACEGWALALVALALFAWLERRPGKIAAVYLPFVIALAVSGALVQHLKDVFATPRPLAIYGPELVHVRLEPLFMFGFPSGHSSAVAVFATFTALAYGPRARWAWLFMLAGGISRVYVGAHWLTDVLGGWALGALLGFAAHRITLLAAPEGHLASIRRTRRNRGPRCDGAGTDHLPSATRSP